MLKKKFPFWVNVLKVRHKKVQRLQLTLGPSYVLLHLLIIPYVRTERLCNLEDGEWMWDPNLRTTQIGTVTGVRFLICKKWEELSISFPLGLCDQNTKPCMESNLVHYLCFLSNKFQSGNCRKRFSLLHKWKSRKESLHIVLGDLSSEWMTCNLQMEEVW